MRASPLATPLLFLAARLVRCRGPATYTQIEDMIQGGAILSALTRAVDPRTTRIPAEILDGRHIALNATINRIKDVVERCAILSTFTHAGFPRPARVPAQFFGRGWGTTSGLGVKDVVPRLTVLNTITRAIYPRTRRVPTQGLCVRRLRLRVRRSVVLRSTSNNQKRERQQSNNFHLFLHLWRLPTATQKQFPLKKTKKI